MYLQLVKITKDLQNSKDLIITVIEGQIVVIQMLGFLFIYLKQLFFDLTKDSW